MRPVVIDVEYRVDAKTRAYRPKDIGNAIASTKAAIDGMVDAGVIPDDTKRWLAWGQFDLITRKHPKGEGVTITVRAQ